MRSTIFGLAFTAVVLGCASGQAPQAAVPVAPGEFGSPRKVRIDGWDGSAMEPFLSSDGRWLFFNNRNDPAADTDIYYAERTGEDAFRFVGPVLGVNQSPPVLDAVPSMDDAGNLFFISTRSYTSTLRTLHMGHFAAGRVDAPRLVAGDFPRLEAGWLVMDAEIGRRGDVLYFVNARFDGRGVPSQSDIGVAARDSGEFRVLKDSDDLLRLVNTSALEYAPSSSAGGLELYFTRLEGAGPRIMVAKRASTAEPFGQPNVVAGVGEGFVEAPALSADGKSLLYHRLEGDRYVIYRVVRS
jgi:hypothetical protein